ncbi:MAG: CarD family transcriptional regulator, partial [Solirubrobacterales bacterium]|nr:CarD family transcriptional regulator [Solirubrobacterales bacterium]
MSVVSEFKKGEKVVYPRHGAGVIMKKAKAEKFGESREYLTIKSLHNEMTVEVPVET